MSVFGRIGNVFIAPDKCFTSLRDEGKKWTDYVIPILLLSIMVILFMYVTADIMKDVQREAIMKMEQYSDAQKETILAQSDSSIAQTMKYVSGILGVVFTALFGALIMMLVGNFIGGGEQKYATLLVTALYVQLISIPESIIKIFLILQKESVNVYLGLGSLISTPDQANYLHNFIGQFEFFKIWRIIVWIVAFKVLYKFTGKKATWLVVVTMLIGMILSAAITTFSAGRMG